MTDTLPTDSLVYVLMGPSGVGKSTLAHAMLTDKSREFNFKLNRAWRTRAKRPAENDDNYHCSIEEFEAADQAGTFLFTMDVYGEKTAAVVPHTLPPNSFWLYIYLPENALKLKQFYPNARLVEILPHHAIVPEDVLLERDPGIDEAEMHLRLESRDLELTRGKEICDLVYLNDKPLDEAGKDFYRFISEDIKQQTANPSDAVN